MNTDWLITARQLLPRLVQLPALMRPSYRFDDVSAVCDAWLAGEGFEAVLWDVDGTLMEYHASDIAPQFRRAVRSLFVSGGARHAILSNCGEARFLELGATFAEVPVMRGYGVGDRLELRYLLDGTDTHTAADLKALARRGGHPVRKPDARLIQEAGRLLGVEKPEQVLMVGDQYLTDMATANLAGARGAKVRTYRRDTFPLPVRLSQVAEGIVFRMCRPTARRRRP